MKRRSKGLLTVVLGGTLLFIHQSYKAPVAAEDTGTVNYTAVQTTTWTSDSVSNTEESNLAFHEEETAALSQQSDQEEVHEQLQVTQASMSDAEWVSVTHWIEANVISQLPELYNGCEITSLAMLLNFMQIPVDKMDLADMLAKDYTAPEQDEDGTILVWGDPDEGFVGDIYGDDLGYGVYVKPIAQVLDQLYEPGSLDLSGRDWWQIEDVIADGKPVIIWNIASFEPSDAWMTWKTPEGKDVAATFQEHCVLLVGYDDSYVYINNPFEEIQGQMVDKSSFIAAWEQMGSKALTYK